MNAIVGSMPFTMLDDIPVHFGKLTSARLKRAYATSRWMAIRIQVMAQRLGSVTILQEIRGGWVVFWAPDWEDFWPA